MALKRIGRKRRGRRVVARRGRGGWLKSAVGVAETAMKAYTIAKSVQAIVNTEFKYYSLSSVNVTPNWNGTYFLLNSIPQGITAVTRTGDSVKLKNLVMRYEWFQNMAIQEEVRVIIYWNKENNISTGPLMLTNAGSSLVTMSSKLEDNRYDTKIIYDKTHKVTSMNPIVKGEFNFKLDHHTHFNAGTASPDMGALSMLVFSQQSVAGSNFSYVSRLSFVDN